MDLYLQEFIQDVMYAYCHGLSVVEISNLTASTEEHVNNVINRYQDLFLEGWL